MDAIPHPCDEWNWEIPLSFRFILMDYTPHEWVVSKQRVSLLFPFEAYSDWVESE